MTGAFASFTHMVQRKTLSRTRTVVGTGLHGGRETAVTLSPGSSGIVFARPGLPPLAIADLEVVATDRCTRIRFSGGATTDTVEHLMAAIAMSGVTDVVVVLTGDEVPILDGSAMPWLHELSSAGFATLPGAAPYLEVVEPFDFTARGASYAARPGPLSYDVSIDFPHPSIGKQRIAFEGGEAAMLADSRTFAMEHEIAALRSAGLARGGGLHNAVVVGEGGPLNPEGFRHPDECVRHKALDLIGDLHMLGVPIVGRFTAYRPGHSANGEFLKAMVAAGVVAPADARPAVAA